MFSILTLNLLGGSVLANLKLNGVAIDFATLETITESLAGRRANQYAWLEWNGETLSGKFLQRPEREDIPENIKEQLIVELYSK